MDDATELIKLEKKLRKSTGGDLFVKEARQLDGDQDIKGLEFKLKELAKHRQAIISTRQDDEELKKAKKVVTVLNRPYNEQLNAGSDKSRFIGLLLQEREGFDSSKGLTDNTDEE